MDTRTSRRLADRIGLLRSVLISVILVGTVAGAVAGAETGSVFMTLMYLLAGTLVGATVYLTLGWMEHTLLLVAEVADQVAAGSRQVPTRPE